MTAAADQGYTLREANIASPSPKRLLSIDVFRGIAIAGMILVNSPGTDTNYAELQHAVWHGWTPADLIFPGFLFIMGVSLAISLGRRLGRGEARGPIMTQILWRTMVIFWLGMVTNVVLYQPPAGLRFMGVLQRIAACYFFCAVLFLSFGIWGQVLILALLLVGYWALMTYVPVPGVGPGVLTPEGNLASYVDRLILGKHMFCPIYDPEGILSTIPSIATALLGVVAGRWLRSRQRHGRKAVVLLISGLACAAAGAFWGLAFPINKHLWTSSYALFNGGLALCGFAGCYWLVEIIGFTAWGRPFQIFGRNPLLSYFLSGLFYDLQEFIKMRLPDGSPGSLKLWLCWRLFGSWLDPRSASLAYALSYGFLCLGLMAILYRRKIFLKI